MVHHLLWLSTVAVRGSILFFLFTLSTTTASRGEVGCREIEEHPWLYISYTARLILYASRAVMGCSTYRNTSCNGTTHANRQELQADLVGGVHPAETFAGDIAEVGTLVATTGQLRSPRLMKRMKQAHYSASTMWLSSTASNFSGTIPLKSTNDRVILDYQPLRSCPAITI